MSALRDSMRRVPGHLLAAYARAVRTWVFHLVRRSDTAKWKNYKFPPEWAMRSQRIAESVPCGACVFEFGAGTSGLRDYLHPSCTLISSDLIERSPGMLVVDLNRRPLPPISGEQPRVAVFSGVLEYLSDVPCVLRWIAQYFELCVASYECAQPKPGVSGRVREIVGRVRYGWVNHYTQAELTARFAEVGFQLVKQSIWGTDDPGQIFIFRRSQQSGPN